MLAALAEGRDVALVSDAGMPLISDPGFKLACGRLPDSGADLCSQPTVSRWENAPSLREVVRHRLAIAHPGYDQAETGAP